MRIIVLPYNARWPQMFELAAREIESAMGRNLVAIHHIGSTAIPGIHAKPVIDMLAIVSDIDMFDSQIPRLQALGYEAMGEFGIPGRRYFRRDNPNGVRTHQIHAFQHDSDQIERHLAFRDYIRSHPQFAQEYSDLKRRLAAAHSNDINAYMDGKDGFIKKMEARALAWKPSACRSE